MRTVSDRLREGRRPAIGREQLLSRLASWAREGEAPVTFVHGVPGIGKTTLVGAVAGRARETGMPVFELDCGAIEPTDVGVFDALGGLTGTAITSLADLSECLSGRGALLVLDGYETWRLLDTWVRQSLVPALPASTHVLIAGRFEPTGPWRHAPEWRAACAVLELGPLDPADAEALLAGEGLSGEAAHRVNAIARGHPLALTLAASSLHDRPGVSIDEAAIEGITQALAAVYLEAAADGATREALEAASVTRRTTEPLLAAQLGSAEAAARAYARIEALPFVRAGWDGLVVHEAVKQAGAARLRASRPARHRELRLAAWRHLQQETRGASENELWRYTADMLYLLESPVLRDGFFPRAAESVTAEPAGEADLDAIRAISLVHDGPESTAILEAWWRRHPRAFKVIRNPEREVVGFRCSAVSNEIDPALAAADPVLSAWLDELRASEHPELPAFLLRRWLGRDDADRPGEVQGLCWIECKSIYLKLRPMLGHVYVAMRDLQPYEGALAELGFSHLTRADRDLDGRPLRTVAMSFGPGSVDGWLSRLAAQELGVDPTGMLDEAGRQLLIEGVRVPLTPLEFGVMRLLLQRRGQAVSRADLVEQVWGYRYTGESNVEAVVIRGLRAKLGAHAGLVETVRGTGYRLREA